MPDDVSIVPLWIVASVLVLYVIVIGPVDYFVLGWLRMRRFTWVTFPASTIGVGLFFVWISNYYLGSASTNKSITIIDMGTDGTALRKNQFELLFLSKRREYETELRNSIFTPMNHQQFMNDDWMWRMDPYNYRYRGQNSIVGRPTFSGTIPARYVVRQAIPQWTPQLNRQFMITPTDEWSELSDLDWGSWEELSTQAGFDAVVERVSEPIGGEVTAYLYHAGKLSRSKGSPIMGTISPDERYTRYPLPRMKTVATDSFLHEVCVRPQVGLFAALARISPTGGDNFEDLAMLDPTDKNTMLLAITVARGQDIVVYRRLYTSTEE